MQSIVLFFFFSHLYVQLSNYNFFFFLGLLGYRSPDQAENREWTDIFHEELNYLDFVTRIYKIKIKKQVSKVYFGIPMYQQQHPKSSFGI